MYGKRSDYSTGIPGVDAQDLRRAFKDLDLDNDGLISARDLRTFLEACGERPSDEEINEMIKLADHGNDGFVHFTEFTDLFKSLTPDGQPNEVFDQTVKIMATTRLDSRESTVSNEEMLKQFISRLPGAVQGKPFIAREYLREVIFRWKSSKTESVTMKEFLSLLKVQKNGLTDRAFKIFCTQADRTDIKSMIVTLGAFVAAPCDERIDFACRILDEASSGLLSETDIMKLLQANFVGAKADLKTRRDRIVRGCDANGLLSRKKISTMCKDDPGLFFPIGKIEFPIKR